MTDRRRLRDDEIADLRRRIGDRARSVGIELPEPALERLVEHAREVFEDREQLHLTSIDDLGAFVERHVGESLEGAALLPSDVAGRMLDVGSGNGYPGLVVGTARAGLSIELAESSHRKAEFLGDLVRRAGIDATVRYAHLQRPGDLPDPEVPIDVLTSRAMGNWERVLPRFARALTPDTGRILLWAGCSVESVRTRAIWRRLELVGRHALPDRDQSWIWVWRRSPD